MQNRWLTTLNKMKIALSKSYHKNKNSTHLTILTVSEEIELETTHDMSVEWIKVTTIFCAKSFEPSKV